MVIATGSSVNGVFFLRQTFWGYFWGGEGFHQVNQVNIVLFFSGQMILRPHPASRTVPLRLVYYLNYQLSSKGLVSGL